MPARTRSFVPAIASACAIIALLALALSALAAPPPAAPQAPCPDVAVDTWPEGNRETHAGGRSIFNVVYRMMATRQPRRCC